MTDTPESPVRTAPLPGTAVGDVAPFGPRLRWHLVQLMTLAWPVMLSRAGILMLAFADIAMLGRHGPGAVGEATLGLAIFVPALVLAIGLVSGSVPVIARAEGAGNRRETGHAWRRAMAWGIAVSAVGALATWHGDTWLALAGIEASQAEAGGAVARMLAPGLIAQVLFAVCAFYLEATGRPLPALAVMAGANIANLGLNWLMIGGNLGLPGMGAEGAALATTIVRWGAVAAMVAIILTRSGAREAGVFDARAPGEHRASPWGPGGWRAGAMMRRLGLSAGLSNGFETIGFAVISLFAGQLGRLSLDAYAISHNLVTTIFMVGLGLAVATGVRVGHETGRGRPGEAAFAGWCGMGAAAAVMGVLTLAVLLFRPAIAAVYTNDTVLAGEVVALLAFSALIFAPDSLQVVAGQAIRALGDAWVAIGIYVIAFVVLMIPAGWWLAMHTPLGVLGLPLAITACCLVAFVLLAWRFRVLTLRIAP